MAGIPAQSVTYPHNALNLIRPTRLSAWFRGLNADQSYGPAFELGDVSDVAHDATEEMLDHFSARHGISNLNRKLINKFAGSVNITLHEWSGNNLALMFRSTTAPFEQNVTIYDQKQFVLVGTTAVPIDENAVEDTTIDFLELEDVVVFSIDGATVYEEGVDYTFTQAAGSGDARTMASIARIDSTDSSIVDGQPVMCKYTYQRVATIYNTQEGSQLEGMLILQAISDSCPAFQIVIPRVNVYGEGAMNINPEEWMMKTLKFEILSDGAGSRGYFALLKKFVASKAAAQFSVPVNPGS